MASSIVFVCMPWARLDFPSIALGILTRVCRDAGLSPNVHSYNLRFMEHLLQVGRADDTLFSIGDYHDLSLSATATGVGDWLFSIPPFRSHDPDAVAEYLSWVGPRLGDELTAKLNWIRAQVPAFIEHCADDILAEEPKIVGFTSSFSQNVPSLLLAQTLKRRAPSLTVVFGGANCDGAMGLALHRSFPWVDVVVQGEAEAVIVDLFRDILAGRSPTPGPGLCVRQGDDSVADPGRQLLPEMDEIPTPDYDFYFEELKRCQFHDAMIKNLLLPVESARGCWWGEKNHCTFCGLNGSSMAFRSKSVDRALADILDLAERYNRLDFQAVDNIIDLGYLEHLLPRIRAADIDLTLFYETKANLTKDQLRSLRTAGVTRIQPGIESLSTPILKLMKKGVSAWQNIRLLKWCEQFGITVVWNLIFGFPGEPIAEYERMAGLIPWLTHLRPPNLTRLSLQRFSPYFERPSEYGITVTGPRSFYRHIYDLDPEALSDLAYDFEYTYDDERAPGRYVQELRDKLAEWRSLYRDNRGGLTYRRGPGFLRIVDQRQPYGYTSYILDRAEAFIYLACDAGATPNGISRQMAHAQDATRDHAHLDVYQPDEVEDFLHELVAARLAYHENGRFLSLALPEHGERDRRARSHAEADSGQPGAGSLEAQRSLLPVL